MAAVITYSVAGCKFSIGGAALDPQDVDMAAADFSSITWTEIKNWTTMGQLGDAANTVTNSIIGLTRDIKTIGSNNGGQMQNVFALLPTDAGQAAMIAAFAARRNYPFKIEYNDKPAMGASPKNSLRYFVGIITNIQETGGDSSSTRNLMANIEINSNNVRVAASAT